jgi:hypothetical protein
MIDNDKKEVTREGRFWGGDTFIESVLFKVTTQQFRPARFSIFQAILLRFFLNSSF